MSTLSAVIADTADMEAYVADRVPTIAKRLARKDIELRNAWMDAWSPQVLAGLRVHDDAALGRIVREGVQGALREQAASLAEAEYMGRCDD